MRINKRLNKNIMKNYLTIHPWKIIEQGFHPEYNRITESLFSIGNGKMGMRGNFAEDFSGDSLQGNYLAGLYYPDKTKVGWWKNGYPDYFAKTLNAVNWISLSIKVNGQILDLNKCETTDYKATLDMKESVIYREFRVKFKKGESVVVQSQLFYSMDEDNLGVLKYSVFTENFNGTMEIKSTTDFNVVNKETNYGEKFWKGISTSVNEDFGSVKAMTKKTEFTVNCTTSNKVFLNENIVDTKPKTLKSSQKFSHNYTLEVKKGDVVSIEKYAAIISSFFYDELKSTSEKLIERTLRDTFENLKKNHTDAWAKIWKKSDVQIKGDDSAQQAIRYNILQLNQTYTGKDSRLNIGPKGFTGEKYGGSTYWDTEAYCLPFYLYTADKKVSQNLLHYRYNHLQKAIENAEKLGFENGAALYPMVTMNGEECHNEWEITFEEIHRNGAIAYAIYNYTRFTGDDSYLNTKGLEVLVGISRFWAQRFNYSRKRNAYVMLGVTGPNEYENNVNNNWYTNYIARWCLIYTSKSLKKLKKKDPKQYNKVIKKTKLKENKEVKLWKEISSNIYFPFDKENKVFMQQCGFLDKEITSTDKLKKEDRPISQNWSWDRILRSCFIKQADVLQGLYFFSDKFTTKQLKRNFNYYEPLTVHESSLSPCVHSIIASKIGNKYKAYELFQRTARLDLDDINNDTEDGCHITSMAGTMLTVIEGFGGISVKKNLLHINPQLPHQWKSLKFKINFREVPLCINIKRKKLIIKNDSDSALEISLFDKKVTLKKGKNEF